MQSLHTSATGMEAAITNINVISNNLANQGTNGYKRRRAEFHDLLYIQQQKVGTNTSDAGTIKPTGIQIGLGVATGAVYPINEQGSLKKTDSTFDLAINGNGYFKINLPDGTTGYTRDGSFTVNESGVIVTTNDGYEVSPSITIPSGVTNVTINKSGEVLATIDGQAAPSNLGQLDLTNFINPTGLEAKGSNILIETAASGAPIDGLANSDGYGNILQGHLETSNVSSVTELTLLVEAQRMFEYNTKVMESSNEVMKTLNDTV